MRLHIRFLGALLLLLTACLGGVRQAQAQPLGTGEQSLGLFDEQPLNVLVPGIEHLLQGGPGRIGVAVVAPSRQSTYVANADSLFHMASVAKVPIMMAVLEAAEREQRPITDNEMELLRSMITESDNNAADELWNSIDGGVGLNFFLNSTGATGIFPSQDEQWGVSLASPKGMAALICELLAGGVLDENDRATALHLMEEVEPEQAWGVTAVLPEPAGSESLHGVKNGWYDDDGGWWINSAGFVLSGDARPGYAMVVFTDQDPSMDEGIQRIEAIARGVHDALEGGGRGLAPGDHSF